MSESPKLSIILLSYWPFYWPDNSWGPGRMKDINGVNDIKDFTKELEVSPGAKTVACLWMSNDSRDEVCPVLIIERGDELYQHLNSWSENDIPSWFKLYIYDPPTEGGRYAVVLYPRLNKSTERWRVAYGLTHGQMPPDDTAITILYRTISYGSGGHSPAFHVIKKLLPQPGSKMTVGIIDAKHFTNPDAMDSEDIYFINGIELGDPKNDPGIHDHLVEFLQGLEKPNTSLKSWINPEFKPT